MSLVWPYSYLYLLDMTPFLAPNALMPRLQKCPPTRIGPHRDRSTRRRTQTQTQRLDAQFSLTQSLCLHSLLWRREVNFLPTNILSLFLLSSPLLSSCCVYCCGVRQDDAGAFPTTLMGADTEPSPLLFTTDYDSQALWDACLNV